MAPAEVEIPLELMLDKNAEVLVFPSKFPLGRNGYTDNRPTQLSLKKYFIQRLLKRDKRFVRDTNYIFYVQYATEMK